VAQPVLVEQSFQAFSSRIPLIIIGVLDRYDASAFISIDNAFFVSLETARTLTNQRYYNLILVRADRVENVQSVVDQLTAIYGERARIIALQTLSSTISGIIGQFSVLLGSVAGISLTVAGLGIMNIMLVSVIERTKEIGVMKAVGFRDREVLSVFLLEALMVGVFGGVLGIALGVVAAYGLPALLGGSLFFGQGFRPPARGGFGPPGFGGQSASITITPVIPLDTVAIAYGFAILVCLVAGIYPAWRAARLDPIKAIRYE
jgi:putative ABC transport system permease protein